MLIAGCGTGQQAVMMARQYEGARILAVDLSLASLCYAKYRTDALGLNNIEYGQADILKLASIGSSVRRHRMHRRSAPSWRSAGRLARFAVDSASERHHAHRPLQRACTDRCRRDTEFPRHCGATRRTIDDIRRCRQDILASRRGVTGKSAIAAQKRLLHHQQLPRSHVPCSGAPVHAPTRSRICSPTTDLRCSVSSTMPMCCCDIERNSRTIRPALTSIIGTHTSSRIHTRSRACISSSCKSRRNAWAPGSERMRPEAFASGLSHFRRLKIRDSSPDSSGTAATSSAAMPAGGSAAR